MNNYKYTTYTTSKDNSTNQAMLRMLDIEKKKCMP